VRYLLLSDLHSNHEATQAVLQAVRPGEVQKVVVLGDLVGYGPSPNEVVESIRHLGPCATIRGNHDKVVAGLESGEDFNRVAMAAARINRRLVSDENLGFLETLSRGPLDVAGSFTIAHGTPLDEDEYLVDEEEAAVVFERTDMPVCFFGHTHLPGAFVFREGAVALFVPRKPEAVLDLEKDARYLINPGSVGQPRDEDPRAAFAIYDDASRQVSFRRVVYPVNRALERILEAGLPEVLGERLRRGV
jgi:predicted phosphodiesterase